MKYTLDTIPVLDVMKEDCACPLCRLSLRYEDRDIDSLLSSAYMEPDCRKQTNAQGFCSRHYAMLFERNNRLGLALMADTHLQELLPALREMLTPEKKRFGFSRRNTESASKRISLRVQDCYLCTMLANSMERYAFTFARLALDRPEFADMLRAGKGFCLPHLSLLLQVSESALSAADYASFCSLLSEIEMPVLEKAEENLAAFTRLFDYRSTGRPSPEVRDSVEKAINLLSGACVGADSVLPAGEYLT